MRLTFHSHDIHVFVFLLLMFYLGLLLILHYKQKLL
jgi:hypothetical protein